MSGHDTITAPAPDDAAASEAAGPLVAGAGPGQVPGCPHTLGTCTQPRALMVTAVFAASRDQVRHARHFAKAMLAGWPLADDTALIVSELAANAVLHSASRDGGKFSVHLEAYPGTYAWVEVRDQGGPWTRREHADGRPHGLDIVRKLAADFGVDGDERSGWIAWARLELPKPSAAEMTQPAVRPGGQGTVAHREPAANGQAARPTAAGADQGPSQRGSSWRG